MLTRGLSHLWMRRGFFVLLSTCKALHLCCSARHLCNFINCLFPILFKCVVFHILLGRKHQQRWVLVTDVVCWYKNLHSYKNLPQGNQKLARLKLYSVSWSWVVTPPVLVSTAISSWLLHPWAVRRKGARGSNRVHRVALWTEVQIAAGILDRLHWD